jgi:hypothetical protein
VLDDGHEDPQIMQFEAAFDSLRGVHRVYQISGSI